eukprot:1545341-Rhodomonas_salina.1
MAIPVSFTPKQYLEKALTPMSGFSEGTEVPPRHTRLLLSYSRPIRFLYASFSWPIRVQVTSGRRWVANCGAEMGIYRRSRTGSDVCCSRSSRIGTASRSSGPWRYRAGPPTALRAMRYIRC